MAHMHDLCHINASLFTISNGNALVYDSNRFVLFLFGVESFKFSGDLVGRNGISSFFFLLAYFQHVSHTLMLLLEILFDFA